jgi:pimeloyl-ACP methyl ester carboxylesterase
MIAAVPPEAPPRRRPCRAVLTAALALGAAACSKNESPPAAAPATPAPAITEGKPQIANSADGVHIEYQVYGQGEPAVVLIHGWSCDANYWRAQLEPLKAKYTTITVNLAGHGASAKNRTDWSMAGFGEDVAAVVRQRQPRRVVLVGHSMGAVVALEAARRLGEQVAGIIAVDSLKTIGQPPMSAAEIEMRVKSFRGDFIGRTREFVTTSFFTPDADPAFVRKVAEDMSLAPPEVAVGAMESLLKMDLAAVVAEIRVPVVAINADRTPTDEARIRKSLPQFRAVTLENTGHFLMMEKPQQFNPVLLKEIAAMAGARNG